MHQHLSNCVVMTMHQTNESTLELETLPLSRRVLGQRAVNKKKKKKICTHTHTHTWLGRRSFGAQSTFSSLIAKCNYVLGVCDVFHVFVPPPR